MLDFVECIAKEAGSLILDAFDKPPSFHEKVSYADLVTDTDQQVEELIKTNIHKKYPSHKIIAEESASGRSTLTSEPTWIIDPIDGTSNFVSKFPFCAVSIGYFKDKQAQCAVVFNPISNHMFLAERGKGAFMNGKKLSVSPCIDLHNALILTDWGGDRNAANLDTKAANIRRLISEARGSTIRRLTCVHGEK
ncbi:unnamed protein product [Rodentolepis nana]|uniref:Inositol-1-monophosphatase n=1 Tax=Rodentolepis nana TaxID=102285 RepID=A0A0R3T4A6_RODNA|nr:unnamed protein product [Rodentolepis nana]